MAAYWIIVLLILNSCLFRVSGQDVEEVDAFVTEVMRCANIPGLTLAVVNNGETWLTKGYGVRDELTQEPVTEDTLFLLASTTKAFTGASLALLMSDLEELSFQTPVRDILGDWFYLKDGTRTAQTQLRDVIAHRTGLPGNNDMRLAGWNLTEFVQRLQYLEYTYDFRDRYRYNNVMYSIAALVAETIDGRTWDNFVQDEIFTPLGMSSSTFVMNRERWPEFATGHYVDNGDNRAVSLEVPLAYLSVTPTSGSIGSTATDMIQWLKFQINRGELEDGTVLLPSSDFTETHRSLIQRTANPDFQRPDDPVTYAPPSRYSLGWQETTYRGYELFTHTGTSGGFHSLVAVLPDMDHGLFIGVNKSPDNFARDVISMYMQDTLLGVEPWLDVGSVCDIMNSKLRQFQNISETNTKGSKSGRPDVQVDLVKMVDNYVGIYGNYAYGTVSVNINPDTNNLFLMYGRDNWTWDLTQDSEDVFTGAGREPFWFFDLDIVFEQEGSNPASALTILSFDDELPPRFERDLDLENPPPPPVPCV